jgi:hypothetical protein
MRHQPRDAAVAVEERVYPREAVMRGGSGKDRLGLAEPAVHLLKASEKARNGRRADGDMLANPDISLAQLARDNLHTLVCVRVFDPEQVFRQQFAEAPVNLADGVRSDGAPPYAAFVDPLLNRNVGLSFELEIALLGVAAIVALERAFNVDGVCVVPPRSGCCNSSSSRARASPAR